MLFLLWVIFNKTEGHTNQRVEFGPATVYSMMDGAI
jgi:hypothetical protein